MNKKLILESTRRLVESPGYASRVQQVADEVMKSLGEITADELNDHIRHEAQQIKLPEFGLGQNSSAFKDFVKDVKVELKQSGFKLKRKGGGDRSGKKEKLIKIFNIMQDEIGNSFPDGDPFDHILPRLQKMGINADHAIEWMDKAAKIEGFASYNDMLRQIWDDALSDGDWGDMENPW